jgi:hypothetical protein
MEQFKGDDEGLKKYLTGIQEQQDIDADPQKKMVQIAQAQLDYFTSTTKGAEAAKAATGLKIGASDAGTAILQANYELGKEINKGLEGIADEQLIASTDGLTTEIQKLIETLKNPESTPEQKKEAFGKVAIESKKVTESLGDSIIEQASGVAKDILGEELAGQMYERASLASEKLLEEGKELAKKARGKFGLKDEDDKSNEGELETAPVDTAPGGELETAPGSTTPGGELDTAPGGELDTAPTNYIEKDKPLSITANEVLLSELNPKPLEFPDIDTIRASKLEIEESNVIDNLDLALEGFTKKVDEIKPTTEAKTETTPTVAQTINPEIQKLIDEGIVGEATAGIGNEVFFKEKPTVGTPEIGAEMEAIPETISELPELENLVQKPEESEKGIFDEIIKRVKSLNETPEEEPSAYEGYKKLLEEISGGEVIGQGKEAYILTPEMKKQAEKDKMSAGLMDEIMKGLRSPKSITPPTKEELAEIDKELEIDSYYKKSGEINNEIKNFKKEKIGVGGVEKEGDLSEEDLDTLNSMRKRRDKMDEMAYALEDGEIESFNKKIEPIDILGRPELGLKMPSQTPLSQLLKPEEEEKQTLGEKLKSGVGKIKDKFKKEEKIEPESATTQGEPPKYVVKDAEGNILSESIDKETASKRAGIAGLGIEPELVETSVTETPITEVKEEKQPLGKRIKEGVGNLAEKGKGKLQQIKENIAEKREEKGTLKERLMKLVEEKPAESEGKITIEEPEEVKKIDSEPKEESGYLKMLSKDDSEADKFLTSKSGLPVNLDKIKPKEGTKSDLLKSFEESTKKIGNLKIGPTEEEPSQLGKFKPSIIGEYIAKKQVEEPEETEIQKTVREAREKQLAYLEELRLQEQPETPSRGIEKIAGGIGKIGEIGKKLFGPIEEEPTFEEFMPTEEAGFEFTPPKEEDYGFPTPEEIEAPEAPEIGIPEIPTPQGASDEFFEGQNVQGETEGGVTVDGGRPIQVEVIHTFKNLPATIDTAQLKVILGTDNTIQQAIAKAVEGVSFGLTK